MGVHKRGVAFARNIYDPTWSCKVDEGLAGLAHCQWAPSGRQILTISDMKLRLTIWNLVDQTVQYIPCPKHEASGIDFNPDGSLMAVILKNADDSLIDSGENDGGDVVGLYNTKN